MSENKTSTGIGFSSLLTIAFIVLKLCNVINWSWWWVLCPIWIQIAIVLIVAILYTVAEYPSRRRSKKREKRIKEIMSETGLNEWAAARKYNEENGIVASKSKWMERLEEMQSRNSVK